MGHFLHLHIGDSPRAAFLTRDSFFSPELGVDFWIKCSYEVGRSSAQRLFQFSTVLPKLNVDNRQMSTGLRSRESYHVARKIFHFTTIMAFAVMYSAKFSRWDLAKGLALMDACVLASELARLRISSVNRLLFR